MFNVLFSLSIIIVLCLIVFILRQQSELRNELERLRRTSDRLSSRLGVCSHRLTGVDLQVAKLINEGKNHPAPPTFFKT